jgi:hypothetical protein
MMSNKLTYKKVLVDSAFRLSQSRSSSDFIIELDQNMECPEGTRLHITEVSIPATFKTTEVGFFEYLYVMVFDNTDTFVKNFRVYLGNKIYFAEQLAYDMNEGMNSNTEDLTAGGIFVYSYSSATRTVEFKIKDGLNYKLKIPTDTELKNYVNNTWNTTQSNYDSSNPLSINYLLSNYVATSPIATWTSSYLNLVPFRAVYINSPELADHHLMSPSTYSSSIIRKVIVSEQLGGIINDNSAPLSEDYINVGGKNLKRLTFRITDDKSNTLNLYDIPCQFSLVFSHPSY